MPPAFGVYLHVPFCRHRCDYCAFATWTDRTGLAERYLAACRTDVERADLPSVTSVFVGGGTPNLVDAHLLVDLLAAVPLAPGAEVTVECNPDEITPEQLATYRAGGVTRISMGVQSMVPHVLASLGRTHDPAAVARAVGAVRAEGLDLNLDLIYGAAGESLDDWATTVDGAIGLGPDHVSAYGLTVEPGTPLAAQPERHPDDDDQADKYLLADDRLAAAGFEWYEVSNWARPGHRCRHNLLYWTGGDYHAVGCAAHGHRAGRRWWNVRTPERYIDAIESGRSPEAGGEELPPEGRALEALQLALRLRSGVPAEAFSASDRELLGDLLEDAPGGRLVLTRQGRLLANEVALRLQVPVAVNAPVRRP